MKRIFTLGAFAGVLQMGLVSPMLAQADSSAAFFKTPIFMLMPSVITLDAISAPAGAPNSQSGFNARFQTVLPTASKWLTGVAGVQFMPNGPNGSSPSRLDQPIVFYGLVVPVLQPQWTSGWLQVTADPLGVYFLNPRPSDTHQYSHEFVMEGAAIVPFGAKMMSGMGAFSRMAAFFLMDQRLTHPTIDANGNKDRFDPVLVYGVTIPIAP